MPVEFPFYVTSKGRAETATLPQVLQEAGVPCTLVVEPQDGDAYCEAWPGMDVLQLGRNEQGIAYARNAALDDAERRGVSHWWLADDNVRGFGEVCGRRVRPVLATVALGAAEEMVRRYERVAVVGFDYPQYAWSQRGQWSVNRRAWACALYPAGTGARFRSEVCMKSDIDFLLQVLTAGYNTVLWHRYVLDKPAMTKGGTGGSSQFYESGKDVQDAIRLVELWPKHCRLVRKYGRLDVKVLWREFTHPLREARR